MRIVVFTITKTDSVIDITITPTDQKTDTRTTRRYPCGTVVSIITPISVTDREVIIQYGTDLTDRKQYNKVPISEKAIKEVLKTDRRTSISEYHLIVHTYRYLCLQNNIACTLNCCT